MTKSDWCTIALMAAGLIGCVAALACECWFIWQIVKAFAEALG